MRATPNNFEAEAEAGARQRVGPSAPADDGPPCHALAVSDNQVERDAMATIEIRISSLAQLFNALDPAPLQARALDPRIGSYILGCAGTHRPTEPLRLLVHLSDSLRAHAADATDAIHDHFRRAHAQGERSFRRRLRIGGLTLAVALGVLAGSFGLRSLLSNVKGSAFMQGLGEGLLILGWVAMWRPVEILLWEHWESHLDHAMLERLASIPVEFVFQPDAARETRPDLQDER